MQHALIDLRTGNYLAEICTPPDWVATLTEAYQFPAKADALAEALKLGGAIVPIRTQRKGLA